MGEVFRSLKTIETNEKSKILKYDKQRVNKSKKYTSKSKLTEAEIILRTVFLLLEERSTYSYNSHRRHSGNLSTKSSHVISLLIYCFSLHFNSILFHSFLGRLLNSRNAYPCLLNHFLQTFRSPLCNGHHHFTSTTIALLLAKLLLRAPSNTQAPSSKAIAISLSV